MTELNLKDLAGEKNDPGARYKINTITLKYEGRGNGKKTVIENIIQVCEELNTWTKGVTEPQYLLHFFQQELGAQKKNTQYFY